MYKIAKRGLHGCSPQPKTITAEAKGGGGGNPAAAAAAASPAGAETTFPAMHSCGSYAGNAPLRHYRFLYYLTAGTAPRLAAWRGPLTGKGRSLPRTFVKPAAAPAAEKPASKAPAEKAPRKAPANVRLQPHDAMVGAYHRSMEAARTTSVVPSSGSPPLFSCGVSRAATHTLPIDCISLIDRRPWVRPVRRTSSTSA